jgi:hypothetical protein
LWSVLGVVGEVEVEVEGSSSAPRRGQISSASKRDSSRVRLDDGSVRELESGAVPVLSFVLPLALGVGIRVGGRGEEGPVGGCGAKRRFT